MCVCVCVHSIASGRKGQRSFGSSVRCVWQTAGSSLGQTLSLIQAQPVIGIWIWANNNNVILTASHGEYYSNWHNIISCDLLGFIAHFSFFMIFGNESTEVGGRRSCCVIKSHTISGARLVVCLAVPGKSCFNIKCVMLCFLRSARCSTNWAYLNSLFTSDVFTSWTSGTKETGCGMSSRPLSRPLCTLMVSKASAGGSTHREVAWEQRQVMYSFIFWSLLITIS